jgi:hypothetical protein
VYQASAPSSPQTGDVWVDSDAVAGVLNQNDYLLKADASASTGYVSKVGGDTVIASGAAVKPLVLKGASAQTANLQEWQDSTGAVVASVSPTGNIVGGGLVHISTQVGTASITSFNNVFTTAYTNYRIILSMTGTSSASSPLYMRLRAGGVDTAGAAYKYALSNLSTTGTVNTSQSNGTDVFLLTFISSTSGNISVAMDLMLPQVNTRTLGTFQLMGFDGGNFYVRNSGIQHDAVTQFDGFSILTGSAATIDSTISVYGYRKA